MNELLRSRRCRAPFRQQAQLSFRNSELSHAAVQADNEPRKYQNGGLVPISGKVDVDLRAILCLVVRSARPTSHDALHPIPARSGLIVTGSCSEQYEFMRFITVSLVRQSHRRFVPGSLSRVVTHAEVEEGLTDNRPWRLKPSSKVNKRVAIFRQSLNSTHRMPFRTENCFHFRKRNDWRTRLSSRLTLS